MAYPVKFFHSGMADAPVLSNNWGDLIGLLDACLVTGFNLKTINSLTATAGVATATINSGHSYVIDQIVTISGCDQAAYNGEQRITGITASTFTFDVVGNPATPATTQSNIACKVAPLGFEKAFSGTNKAAYRSTNPASSRHYLRVDDDIKPDRGFGAYDTTWAKWANVGICESMTDIDTIIGAQAPFNPLAPTKNWASTEPNQWGWHKWYHGRTSGSEMSGAHAAGPRRWVIIGDDRLFYLYTTGGADYNWYGMFGYCFGDPISFKPGDAYGTILQAEDSPSSVEYYSYPGAGMRYGGVMNASLEWKGKVMLRNYTQVGNPIRWGVTSLNTSNSTQISGLGQNIPFPNGPDFALWLLPTYIQQEDGHMRGLLPGVRWVAQNITDSHLSVIDNVVNEGTKKFLVVRFDWSGAAERGAAAFDITGPWR